MKKALGLLLVLLLVVTSSAMAQDYDTSRLRVTFSWPNFIDPAIGNDFSSSTSLTNIYDALVFPNADGSVSPWLAESWEISDDGLVYA